MRWLRVHLLALLCGLCLLPMISRAQTGNDTPEEIQGVGVDETKLGSALPKDLVFTDEKGRPVQFGSVFNTGKPVLMQLGYFGCPMLCDQVSRGMIDTLKELELTVGKDFSIVYVSFDPKETYVDGYEKKKGFVGQYNRPGASADGWTMLVGEAPSVTALTDAAGFRYKWIASQQLFSHSAVLILLTPDGKVSRYLYPTESGMRFNASTLRLSLVEASEGKIGTIGDQILLFCFQYSHGKYSFTARTLLKVAGAVTVLLLGVILGRQFLKEARRSRQERLTVPG